MLSFQDKCNDRAQKKRSKSRKSIIKRKNSIGNSNAIDDGIIDLDSNSVNSHCSHVGNPCEAPQDILSVDQYASKLKELREDRQNLLQVTNSHEKEIDFLNTIIRQFVDLNELIKIKQKSTYDEISRLWNIPSFVVQQRKTIFPKLQRGQLKEVVQSEIKNRKIVFKESFSPIINPTRVENDEDNFRKPAVNTSLMGDTDNRPVTSAVKYRQGSMMQRALEDESRRSPMLRKQKY